MVLTNWRSPLVWNGRHLKADSAREPFVIRMSRLSDFLSRSRGMAESVVVHREASWGVLGTPRIAFLPWLPVSSALVCVGRVRIWVAGLVLLTLSYCYLADLKAWSSLSSFTVMFSFVCRLCLSCWTSAVFYHTCLIYFSSFSFKVLA